MTGQQGGEREECDRDPCDLGKATQLCLQPSLAGWAPELRRGPKAVLCGERPGELAPVTPALLVFCGHRGVLRGEDGLPAATEPRSQKPERRRNWSQKATREL